MKLKNAMDYNKCILYNTSFCRDNKGRTYLAYTTDNKWKLERYTSEGSDDKTFSVPADVYDIAMLASDHKTGAVYAVVSTSGGPVSKVCRIQENGNFEEITLEGESEIKIIGNIAVYDNVLIAYIGNSSLTGFKISGNKAKKLKDYTNINDDTDIKLDTQNGPGHINDLYMTSDSLYVVFSAFNSDSNAHKHYSLGGIVKYSYTADGTISKIKRIGIKDSHTADANNIYATDDGNFYGPVKVIGFDDENIYIADDGFDTADTPSGVHVVKNHNRIAALNMQTNALSFTDAASARWYNEWKEWKAPNTKTLVWKIGTVGETPQKHYTYYQLNSAGDSLPSEPFEPGDGGVLISNYLTDVFCYDQDGNLYIVKKHNANYQVCRFELQDDGSYDRTPVIAELYDAYNSPLTDKPTAIAVDISGRIKDGGNDPLNVLYYSYGYYRSVINRIEWSGDSFMSASFNRSWTITGPTPTDGGTKFTSLAANKDGLFVGEYVDDTTGNKYTIRVKKYSHNEVNYNAPSGTVTIIDEANLVAGIEESLNVLYIQDGVLYGLTTKTKKEEDSSGKPILFAQSGRLFKVANTSSFPLNGNASKLYGDDDVEDDSDGSFAPYRFIAVKPKKLVIASDGAYGKKNTQDAENKNKVWTFTPDSSGDYNKYSDVDTHGDVKFSKELRWDNLHNSGFIWE